MGQSGRVILRLYLIALLLFPSIGYCDIAYIMRHNPQTGRGDWVVDVANSDVCQSDGTGCPAGSTHDAVTIDANVDDLFTLTVQALSFKTQVKNKVFAGPATGVDAVPTFRLLVADDIPALSYAPVDVNYLVGTANGTLTNEIVVGTTPGGELGGTWDNPTVDATHSGSVHPANTTATTGQYFSAYNSTTGAFTKEYVDRVIIPVRNETGVSIAQGKAVYTTGFNNFPLIALGDNTDNNKHNIEGITTSAIAHEANGYVVVQGLVSMDTNEIGTVGQEVYLSTAGGLTVTKPTSGAVVLLGEIMVSEDAGSILLYRDNSRDSLEAASATDMPIRMGDSIGVNKVSFKDYANNEVASINSDGLGIFSGNILGGSATKQVTGGPELLSLQGSASNKVIIWGGVTTDTNARFLASASGLLEWGAGVEADQDIGLFRNEAGNVTIQSFTVNSTNAFRVNQFSADTGVEVLGVDTTNLAVRGASFSSTVSGYVNRIPATFTIDSSFDTQPSALYVKNANNYAHATPLVQFSLLNGSDSGAVLNLANAGTGNYITADSAFSVSKAGTILATGSLGATGARVTKGWFTDLEVTNAPTLNGVAIPSISSTNTFTNKRITQRVITATDDATAVIDVDVTDQYQLTAVANATTFSTTGTPTAGQPLMIRFKDAGVAKGLTWDAVFRAIGVTLPTTTVANKTHYIRAFYNATDSKWDVLATGVEA